MSWRQTPNPVRRLPQLDRASHTATSAACGARGGVEGERTAPWQQPRGNHAQRAPCKNATHARPSTKERREALRLGRARLTRQTARPFLLHVQKATLEPQSIPSWKMLRKAPARRPVRAHPACMQAGARARKPGARARVERATAPMLGHARPPQRSALSFWVATRGEYRHRCPSPSGSAQIFDRQSGSRVKN